MTTDLNVQKYLTALIKLRVHYSYDSKQFDFLTYLYKNLNIKVSIKDLMKNRKGYCPTPDIQFYELLTYEIISIIPNKVLDITELYIRYYKSQFLTVYDEIQKTDISSEVILLEKIQKYAFNKGKLRIEQYISKEEYAQVLLLLKACQLKIDSSIFADISKSLEEIFDHKYSVFYYDTVLKIAKNGSDLEEYLKLCNKELAKKYGISESKFEKYFLGQMDNSFSFSINNYIPFMLENSTGHGTWYYHSLSKDKDSKDIFYYPDIKGIIRNCFIGYLMDKKPKNFNPENMAKQAAISIDESVICDAIKIDVMNHLFEYMKEKYFELKLKEIDGGFSKDVKASSNSNYTELQQKIADLEAEVQKKNQENEKLKEELSNVGRKYEKHFKSQLTKFVDEEIERYEDIRTKFHSTKEENLALQELVNYLQQPEPEPAVPDDFKVQRLYHMRLLFVGDLTRFGHPELKALFPNSVFMESETADISNLDIEFVVLLTKYMSHAMYYKLCSHKYLYEKMWVNFNTRNYDLLLKTIYSRVNFIGYDEHGE